MPAGEAYSAARAGAAPGDGQGQGGAHWPRPPGRWSGGSGTRADGAPAARDHSGQDCTAADAALGSRQDTGQQQRRAPGRGGQGPTRAGAASGTSAAEEAHRATGCGLDKAAQPRPVENSPSLPQNSERAGLSAAPCGFVPSPLPFGRERGGGGVATTGNGLETGSAGGPLFRAPLWHSVWFPVFAWVLPPPPSTPRHQRGALGRPLGPCAPLQHVFYGPQLLGLSGGVAALRGASYSCSWRPIPRLSFPRSRSRRASYGLRGHRTEKPPSAGTLGGTSLVGLL